MKSRVLVSKEIDITCEPSFIGLKNYDMYKSRVQKLFATILTLLLVMVQASIPNRASARESDFREKGNVAHLPSIPSHLRFLPTGNGHGFQLYDLNRHELVAFLDHPYRYLRAPLDERQDGVQRRNLLEKLQIGYRIKGRSDMRWPQQARFRSEGYLDQTNIIHTQTIPSSVADPKIEQFLFSPFGLEENTVVNIVKFDDSVAEGAFRIQMNLGDDPPSSSIWDTSLQVVKKAGERIEPWPGSTRVWIEQGSGMGALIYMLLGTSSSSSEKLTSRCFVPMTNLEIENTGTGCEGSDLGLEIQTDPLRAHWTGLLISYVEEPERLEEAISRLQAWNQQRHPLDVLTGAREEWARWRKPVPVTLKSLDELKLWRQSEAVLRMAQVREPNRIYRGVKRTNHGMILASLSPGNWTTAWVRDGVYATVALARMGHFEEARKSLDFFLNADPVGKFSEFVGGVPYRISVTRYYGSGEEEADYSGLATPNVETDGWGLFLWAARQYLEHSGDGRWLNSSTRQGSVYEALRFGVVEPIVSLLEPRGPRIMKPDSSIWEVHDQNKKHFAFTSLAAARGICDFAAVSRKAGRGADYRTYSLLADEMRSGFLKAFSASTGYVLGALERSRETDLDGAVSEAFSLDVLRAQDGEVADKTLAHLQKLSVASGGYQRNGGVDPYEANEWVMIDLRMAGALLRMGDRKRAAAVIDRVVRQSTKTHYLVPEMYNVFPEAGPIGAALGSQPMVGYGAGAVVLALLEREGSFEKRECR